MTLEEYKDGYTKLSNKFFESFDRNDGTLNTSKIGREWDDFKIEGARTLYKQGVSMEEIGAALGRSPKTVRYWITYGVKTFVDEQIRKARKRDKNTCRMCFVKGGKKSLPVHHVFKSTDQKLTNLLTVCTDCHFKLHSIKSKNEEAYKEGMESLTKVKLVGVR